MAAARGLVLVRELLRPPQGNTKTAAHRLRGMMGVVVGATAGFLGSAAVASASDGGAACPAYPWPQDGARGGKKVFMQHDCAACHSALPYSVHTAEETSVEARAAEIVVVHEEAAARPAAAIHGAACPPDLSVIARMLEGLRRSNLYNAADELKKRRTVVLRPSPAWLQFLQTYYTRTPQAA